MPCVRTEQADADLFPQAGVDECDGYEADEEEHNKPHPCREVNAHLCACAAYFYAKNCAQHKYPQNVEAEAHNKGDAGRLRLHATHDGGISSSRHLFGRQYYYYIITRLFKKHCE